MNQKRDWSSERHEWDLFSRYESYDAVMLPPGERFNWDFFLEEVLERYDKHLSETRKMNRTDGTFCISTMPIRICFN
jgi:hypothetical protein